MGECVLWPHSFGSTGYGQVRRDGRTRKAHRAAWEDAYGPIPAGTFVCHRCDNRACVNPAHLFLGTHLENMADMRQKGRSNRGSKNGKAVLTEEKAVYAMARLLVGEEQQSVAQAFGVSRPAINMLWNGKRWAHVFATGE